MSSANLEYIDIHCHLNYPDFAEDLEAVIGRCHDKKVGAIIVGTDLATSVRAVEIANAHENIWAIIGLHPIHAHEERFDVEAFSKLAQEKKVVGIGECGYDYFRTDMDQKGPWGASQHEAQHEAFIQQIDLAHSVGKPLMLHLRNAPAGAVVKNSQYGSAYQDALHVLRTHGGGVRVAGDAHFFAGTSEDAKGFLGIGFNVSFTGVVTFTRAYDEIIKVIPADRIMSETDAPFVAPVPNRGQRNEPVYVVEIARKIAEIRGAVTEAEVKAVQVQFVDNARKLFAI